MRSLRLISNSGALLPKRKSNTVATVSALRGHHEGSQSHHRRGSRQRLDRDAVETRDMTPQELTQFVAGEIAKWAPVARGLMLKL
jgi:hypothetical protein